jgi:hypothetical protein
MHCDLDAIQGTDGARWGCQRLVREDLARHRAGWGAGRDGSCIKDRQES